MALYKRPGSKYYWMKFRFDGELVQQSTKCSNKKDAATVEAAFRTQLALGKIGIKPRKDAPGFEKSVDDFLKWMEIEHANHPNSYARYYFSSLPLRKYFGKTKVDCIGTEDIQKFIVWRSNQNSRKTKKLITRATINHEILTLKIIFNRLVDAEFLKENPARSIKSLSENEKQFHVITQEEQMKYLLACPQPLKDVAALMLATGLRCGEVYQLRRQDVFLDKGYLKVVKGKTKSSIRKVHLPDKAAQILRSRLQQFKGECIFPHGNLDGEKATGTLNKYHLETIKKLGYKFRLYDCRHTFATRAVESGVDLVVLASILGHANLKMVMHYAHPSEKHKADAMQHIENAKVS